MWGAGQVAARTGPAPMGLTAGERPASDVDVLAGALAAVEYSLASRMQAARVAGCLPLPGPGQMLAARGWSVAAARRLARCGALAAEHPSVADAWAAGIITSEHVDPIAKVAERFTSAELAAVIGELAPHWGAWGPRMVATFLERADRLLHPPPDPDPDEIAAHEARFLSFAFTPESVLICAELPRLEGEAVVAALDAQASAQPRPVARPR